MPFLIREHGSISIQVVAAGCIGLVEGVSGNVQCYSLLYLAVSIFYFPSSLFSSTFHLPVDHLSVLCFHLNLTIQFYFFYYIVLIYHLCRGPLSTATINFHLSGQL